MMVEEATHALKELVINFIVLVIAFIFSVMALGIANWGISVFGTTGVVAKGHSDCCSGYSNRPTIAAFATKKYV